jgi:hypothetical protein
MSNQKNISQYRYYKGEKECPFRENGLYNWWYTEQWHFLDQDHTESIEEYLLGWFRKKADDNHLTDPAEIDSYVAYHWNRYIKGINDW